MGIPPTSFMATNIIVVQTLTQPQGSQKLVRRCTQVAETAKRIGEPELPQFNRLFEIPSGAQARIEIVSLRSREIDLAELGVTNPVLPAQPSLFKNQDASRQLLTIDENLYAVDGDLGAEYLRVLDLGRLRAARIGRLEVAPVRYNPVRGTLSVVDEIEFVLHFEGGDRGKGDDLRSASNGVRRAMPSIRMAAARISSMPTSRSMA